MASRANTRVPFGDATSRANAPNLSPVAQALECKSTASPYAENDGVSAARKITTSLSAVAGDNASASPQPQHHGQQQREHKDARQREAALQHAHYQRRQQQKQQKLAQQLQQQQELLLQQQQQQQIQLQQHSPEYDMTDAPMMDVAEDVKPESAASKDSGNTVDSKRASQYSSCDGFPNKKSHIGPWQLGRTLGKGSSARVRAARHSVTHQAVAVKIIAKKTARMTQSGSIAQLDQFDSHLPENINGVRRMPLAIEREVAILKLIEHPNIVKLYDIWENRNEIYLILEYVENGDLFTYVSQNGALSEEASIFVFRQMMSAVQYCHALNICHRDLKPENILLKADGQIKIADFGMAALHQAPRSHLLTSCGSPHYAAPELLKARPYRGDKADIWSMGVILFVMLAGRLPFDEDDMSLMLAKAKKGIYTMPSSFSPEAKDLVHRILQIEPEVRISMSKMWLHPLVWKYGYLDDLGNNGTDGQGQGSRGRQATPVDLAHIDTQIFRQLHSMWHTLREDELAGKLVSNEPNDQKLFYWLLYNYRNCQQENFNPTLTHSVSDYHHVNQPYTTKVSTRQFSQSNPSGNKRNVSRFTVISNVAEPEVGAEGGTVKSYDPYKSSIVMQPTDARASHAKIVVHRNNANVEAEVRSMVQAETIKAKANAATTKKTYAHQRRGSAAYLRASRGSMNSIRSTRSARSINGKPAVRPSSRHKRGVDFSKARKPSVNNIEPTQSGTKGDAPRDTTPVWNEDLADFSCRIAKDLDDAFMSSLLAVASSDEDEDRASPFSIRLTSPETGDSRTKAAASNPAKLAASRPWDTRPLPPSPPRSDSMQLEIMRSQAERTRPKPNNVERVMKDVSASSRKDAAVDGTAAQTRSLSVRTAVPQAGSERRVVSAPAARYLPSILESGQENWPLADKDKPRAVSAPSKHFLAKDIEELAHVAQAENTIRLVVSPTATRSKGTIAEAVPFDLGVPFQGKRTDTAGPRAMPERTDQRLKQNQQIEKWQQRQMELQQMRSQRQQRRREKQAQKYLSETIAEEVSGCQNESISGGSERSSILPTRMSWFKRPLKTEMHSNTVHVDERPTSQVSQRSGTTLVASQADDASVPAVTKKKGFMFPFWKTTPKSDARMKVAGDDVPAMESRISLEVKGQSRKNSSRSRAGDHRRSSSHRSKASVKNSSAHSNWYETENEPNGRKIDPQQTWLSRLFRVKPATRHLCLAISQRRARQEVSQLMREWRRYGMRDVEVDKERNIIFAKVGMYNYLGIREVSFACEIITVIEHGKRNHLCILRLTQEKGSASSFHKVSDTLKGVLRDRELLVGDQRKAKMMVKTLNS